MAAVLLMATLAAILVIPEVAGVEPNITRLVGPPSCTINTLTRTLTTTFVSRLNDDNIEHVRALFFNETTNSYQYENCTAEFFTENGVDYLRVISSVNLDDPSQALATNPCGFTATELTAGQWKYKWIIGLRAIYDYLSYGDLDYFWECIPSDAIDLYLSTSVQVVFPGLNVGLNPSNPLVDFNVVDENENPVSTCTVGDLLKFAITMTNPQTYEDYIHFYGLYPYFLRVERDMVNVVNHGRALTGTDGCAENGNPLGLTRAPFYQPGVSTIQKAVYYSGEFKCKRFFGSDELWFSVVVAFCQGNRAAGLSNSADKCFDYCAYNSVRRRRDVSEDNPDPMYMKINVIDVDEAATEKSESLSQTTVIAIAVSISVLVLVLLVAFGCFVWYMAGSKREGRDRGRKNWSQASLDRKLPMKF